MRVDDTKNYKRDNPVSMTRRIQNTVLSMKGKLVTNVSFATVRLINHP